MSAQTLLASLGLAASLSLAPAPDDKFVFINLQPQGNQKLKENFSAGVFEGNHLGNLPQGKHKLGDITFTIGEQMIQLGSTELKDRPAKVEGIAVDQTFVKLHILHATSHSTDNGTTIGSYIIHYADDTTETVEIIYGKDVCDWWADKDDKGPSKGKIVWKGDNDAAKANNKEIRLYLTTWENPKPKTKVKSIDYVNVENCRCGPFCVAMTLE